MARPLVLIFQELAQPQATPNTPDLNTVVLGPAYDLFDYPDDASTILLTSAYGQLESRAGNGTYTGYQPPASGSAAVTVLDGGYPGQSAGSKVDHDSVKAVLRLPHVVLGSTYLNALIAPVFGGSVTTTSADRTLVSITGGVTTDFVAAGIQPGDKIILTSSQAGVEQTVVRVVQSVGEPNGSGLVAPGNENKLRLTQQLPDSGVGLGQWTYDANGEIRIERTLASQDLLDPTDTIVTFPEPGSDKLVIKGGITLSVQLTPVATVAVPAPATTTASRALSYAELYLAYRALRQDLQEVGSVTADDVRVVGGVSTLLGLGKIDSRNPLAVGVYLALQNGGAVPIYFYGVATDDAAGHTAARGALSPRRDLYCFIPLTQDINIHAAYKAEFDQLADPNFAQTNGVIQKFRIVLGSIPLPTTEAIYSGSISGVSQQPSGVNTAKYRTVSLAAASTGSISVQSVLPGDSVTIGLTPSSSDWQNRRGTHTLGHVNSSKNYPNPGDPSAFEVVPGSSRWDDAAGAVAGDIEVLIRAPDGTVKVSNLAQVDISTGAGGTLGTARYTMKNPTTVGGPYTITYVASPGLPAVTVSIAGFAITVTVDGTTHTHTQVVNAVNAHSVVSALLLAGVQAGGAQVVDPATQATRDALTGQTGAAASIVAGAGGGQMRITGVSGMSALSVGRYLTITGAASPANNGTFLISAFGGATQVDVVNAGAVIPDANNGALGWTERYAYTSVVPVTGSCTATVALNDDLFNRLEDASASFLTAGVLPGDTIEFPLDPNNYGPTAYDGRVLSYKVSTVQNENRLLIANGEDDSGSVAKELPHFFARDLQDRFIDNTTPNAQNYRILRALSLEDQLLALVTIAQSVRSKRLTVMWPDQVEVADLRDGALARAVPTTRTLAGLQPSFYLACAVGGVIAGIPPQAGLTNGTFIGFTKLVHSQGYFSEPQLSRLSDGGLFVCVQRTPSALPECIHQLTTDPTAIETGELSVVKNVDFISMFMQDILETFIGQYNVLPETVNELARAVSDGAEQLKGRRVARFGPPLLEGSISSIGVSEFAADRIELFFNGRVARPLNTVAFHLVV
jgi:hypothetical protein